MGGTEGTGGGLLRPGKLTTKGSGVQRIMQAGGLLCTSDMALFQLAKSAEVPTPITRPVIFGTCPAAILNSFSLFDHHGMVIVWSRTQTYRHSCMDSMCIFPCRTHLSRDLVN